MKIRTIENFDVRGKYVLLRDDFNVQIVDGKITRSYIYESIDNFVEEKFHFHIEKMCHELDIPTPAILKSHITNYVDFNNSVFLPRDFIESIDFDKFIIENAIVSN